MAAKEALTTVYHNWPSASFSNTSADSFGLFQYPAQRPHPADCPARTPPRPLLPFMTVGPRMSTSPAVPMGTSTSSSFTMRSWTFRTARPHDVGFARYDVAEFSVVMPLDSVIPKPWGETSHAFQQKQTVRQHQRHRPVSHGTWPGDAFLNVFGTSPTIRGGVGAPPPLTNCKLEVSYCNKGGDCVPAKSELSYGRTNHNCR
jgi:hypothetical protein